MRWRKQWAWIGLLCLIPTIGWGMDAQLRRNLRVDITNGRLSVTNLRQGRFGNFNSERRGGKSSVSRVSLSRDASGMVQFTLWSKNSDERYGVECSEGCRFRVLRMSLKDKKYFKFSQEVRGALRVEQGVLSGEMEKWLEMGLEKDLSYTEKSDPQARTYTANSLWEMILFMPSEYVADMNFVLDACSENMTVDLLKKQFLQSLVRIARLDEELPEESWILERITRLGDDQFAVREAASRELNEVGPYLQAVTDKLDWKALDAEQQMRLQRILAQTEVLRGDEALDYFTRTWQTDARVWFLLLESSSPFHQNENVAVEQLKKVLGDSFSWDAQADEATRAQNLKALREKLGLELK